MEQISELGTILNGFLSLNKARLTCLTRIIVALFIVRTVNLREVAVAFNSKADIDSRYKRIKRFFAQIKLNPDAIACWIFGLFVEEGKKFYLTIDRTNWFWGKAKINILTLGIAYEGIAIPIMWKLLDKAGNATAKEHRDILAKFIKLLGKERVGGVLADREFANGFLFHWLNKFNIPFYIRIKDNTNVWVGGKKHCKLKALFSDLPVKKQRAFSMSIELFGETVFVAGSRSERGELMVVVTNQDPRQAIAIYLRRWEIEMLFQNLKGRGFRFEDTHLVFLERIDTLMAILAIGFCWAHKVGQWRAIKKPIPLNQYKGLYSSCRPQFSYFRYGFDFIRDLLLNFPARKMAFKSCLSTLSLPINKTNRQIGGSL